MFSTKFFFHFCFCWVNLGKGRSHCPTCAISFSHTTWILLQNPIPLPNFLKNKTKLLQVISVNSQFYWNMREKEVIYITEKLMLKIEYHRSFYRALYLLAILVSHPLSFLTSSSPSFLDTIPFLYQAVCYLFCSRVSRWLLRFSPSTPRSWLKYFLK